MEVSPLSIAYLIVCTAISTLSAEWAAAFNQVATSGLLFCLAAIVGVSSCYFDVSNFDPFINEERGFVGVIEATTILYFAYIGFDFLTTMTEEAIDAKRNIPRAIIVSVMLTMVILKLIINRYMTQKFFL